MKAVIVSILAAATALRLLLSLAIIPCIANEDEILSQWSSYSSSSSSSSILSGDVISGILPGIRAAMIDPIHTWDHLEEARFWLRHHHVAWTDSWMAGGGGGGGDDVDVGGYGSIYARGTRIVAPPLIVAILGHDTSSSSSSSVRGDNTHQSAHHRHSRRRATLLLLLRSILLLAADAIGAYCMYRVGMRVLDHEDGGNEAEMERRTLLACDENDAVVVGKGGGTTNEEDDDDDLVIPGILRPDWGWVVDLPTKVVMTLPPHDEGSTISPAICTTSANDEKKHRLEDHRTSNARSMMNDGRIASSTTSGGREPLLSLYHLPIVASISYFINPISMIANAFGSMRGLYDSLLLISLYHATMPRTMTSRDGGVGADIVIPSATMLAFPLCVAAYADIAYAAFLLPISLWRGLAAPSSSGTTSGRSDVYHRDWKVVLGLFVVCFAIMHYLASLLVGGDITAYGNVLIRTILPNIAFVQQDLSGSVPGPSMGLHWYFFVQMFDRFRPYFTVFVGGIPAMFAIPLTIRMYRYPSVLVATFQLLWAIFRPTATVHTLTFGLHLALLNPRTIVRMRNPSLISLCALPVPIILFVVFHRMWLVIGNGNPNYIFFQCLAYGMFVLIITMDFVSATVKRDKVRRMVEKGTIKKLIREKQGMGEEADNCHSTVSTAPSRIGGK